MILKRIKERAASNRVSAQRKERRNQGAGLPSESRRVSEYNVAIYVTISMSVLLSILLILVGIFNAQRTSKVAEDSIERSLKVQTLNKSLEIHEEAMSVAVEFAITSSEPQWLNTYENSYQQLNESFTEFDHSSDLQLIEQIQSILAETVAAEREIFSAIANNEQTAAYSILASDDYQDRKIRQEQKFLTLRATLSKQANEIIETLKHRLQRTTMALTFQLILLIAIWSYVVHVFRKWQSSQELHNKELKHLAHYDPLTGIGNRALFHIKLEEAFARADKTQTKVALILMDIDHFKDINDSLGHEMGDELLKYFASKLETSCRSTDTVVRLGGDEFAIILGDLKSEEFATVTCKKILSLFQKSVLIKDHNIKTGTSIGVSLYPQDADQAEGLLRKADLALYEAKSAGRAGYQLFNDNIENMARSKLDLLESLQGALEKQEFELVYQPIVDLKYREIIGVETLLRWRSPERGFVNPVEFISIAEESGLIVPIGTWVLKTACAQQLRWCSELNQSFSIAVNLSGVQFNEADLHNVVENALIDSGMDNEKLVLEITESTLMETQSDVIDKLNSLRSLGCKLAIDDFGTGYSSLAYLKRFPINYLKLDKAFVDDLPDDRHDVAIARSVINMAHELGIEVVAEGIENNDQLKFLGQSGCDRGQGYYLGKPMSAADFSQFVEDSRAELQHSRFG